MNSLVGDVVVVVLQTLGVAKCLADETNASDDFGVHNRMRMGVKNNPIAFRGAMVNLKVRFLLLRCRRSPHDVAAFEYFGWSYYILSASLWGSILPCCFRRIVLS